ncbi:methylated-DNA--protein-cysteine methyltransferase-like isoform X2 [Haliotis asinina]|uniref:methylated-DNA--protein-cysteine methyltransferase-like isoform X2 n=2 Tax=Haliotis asinina TaxID=109174 RepID=UPI0035320B9F
MNKVCFSVSLCQHFSTMPGKAKLACHHGPTNTFTVTTPIGNMELISCPKGLHFLNQGDSINDDNFKPDLSVKVEVKSQLYQDNGYTYKPALVCVDWLRAYFNQPRLEKDPVMPTICPSVVKEGSFTARVWKTLPEQVGFGQTISYGELAKLCESPRASRAVGMAMATNVIQLIMPCHRVINSNGQLGNYAWGKKNSVKDWLLRYEGAIH